MDGPPSETDGMTRYIISILLMSYSVHQQQQHHVVCVYNLMMMSVARAHHSRLTDAINGPC